MLEQLRKNQKYVIWIVAVVFIIGMGLMGLTDIFFNRKPALGVIDGKKITLEEFQQELQTNIDNYQRQNPDADLSRDIISQLSDQSWQRLVQKVVLDKQIRKKKIKVTETEILNEIQNNPPQEVLQIPQLQTNGRFDRKKYMDALKNDTQFFTTIESYIRSILPYNRLQGKVKEEAKITLDSLKAEYLKENDEMFGKLIMFDYNKLPKPKVTDAEIKAYYDQNKETDKDINKGRSSSMKYFKFEVKPSELDFNLIKKDIDLIYSDLLNKRMDFGQLAAAESDDTGSAAQSGSLGEFGKGQMVPEFDQVAFSLPPGQISKPFKTQFGWHIVKVDSSGTRDGQPVVKASHILKKVETSDETRTEIQERATQSIKLIRQKGIDAAAEALKMKPIDTDAIYEDMDYIPGIGQHSQLLEFAKKKKVGAVSDVHTDRQGNFIVAQITSRTKDRFVPLEKVKMRIRFELEKTKRVETMLGIARNFVKQRKQEQYLEAAETDSTLKIVTLQNLKKDTMIPDGIGKVTEINAAALKLNEGQISNLIESKDGQFIIICEKRVKPDLNSFLKNQDEQKKLRDRMEEQAWNRWYDTIMKKVKIEDNRQLYGY